MASSELPISDWRLERIRTYVAAKIPLVPESDRIVVDKSALHGLVLEALEKHPSIGERLKHLISWIWGGKKNRLQPQEIKKLENTLLREFNKASGVLPFDGNELAQETATPLRRLLMAGPEEHAEEHIPEDKEQIFREWFCLRHALVRADAMLDIIPASDEGGVREVYTRDRYVLIGDIAYLPDPQELQDMNDAGELDTPWEDIQCYKGEIAQIEKTLREKGVKTVTVKGAWFEGGNVVRHFSSRTIFVGIDDPWSSEESASKLISAINVTQPRKWSMVPVTLTNPEEMYHLDTGMSEELPYGEVLISPRVTDRKTLDKIKKIVGQKNIISLSDQDAKNLATNMIDVGDTLILTGTCKKLRRILQRRGYKVVMPSDYKQKDFEFGLGGVHCMTNDIPLPRGKVISLRP